MTREVIPRDQNGRRDPLALIRTTWPILVAIVLASMWLQGRMETPEQKTDRVERIVQREISKHERMAGHQVMEERVRILQQQVAENGEKLDEILDRMMED